MANPLMDRLHHLSQLLSQPQNSQLRSQLRKEILLANPESASTYITEKYSSLDPKLLQLLIQDITAFGPLQIFLDDNSWQAVSMDDKGISVMLSDAGDFHQFPFGFAESRAGLTVLERLAADIPSRFDSFEPVLHRQWRGHVVMAAHPDIFEKPWLKLFKLSVFDGWVNKGLPL